MKVFFTLLMLVFFSNFVQGQIVQDGWSISSEVKAKEDLIGAWDVIGEYDLDNDGNKEFFFSTDPTVSGGTELDTLPWTVFYYENTGDNTFEERWSFTPPIDNGGQRSYPSMAVGDVDQDGKPELYFNTPVDVAFNPPRPKNLYVFEFDGTAFPNTPSETWDMGVRDFLLFLNSGISIGDVDGDGEVEIVIQSRRDSFSGFEQGRSLIVANSSGLDIGLGLGAFQSEFHDSSDVLKGGAVYDPRIVDFDGDNIQEIWVMTWDMVSLAIYEGTAANTYELQVDLNEVFAPLDYGHRRGMRFYDVNNDGKLEMYSTTLSGDGAPGSVLIYIGSTDDVSSLTAEDIVALGGRNPDPGQGGSAIGDIDGDGLMDFLYTATDPELGRRTQVRRIEYKGEGDLADSLSYEWTLFYEDTVGDADLRNLAITDLDSDNKPEVLITNLDVDNTDDAIVLMIESEVAVVGLEKTSGVIKNFSLHQNYPNPFNPGTSIEFDVASPGLVMLEVYNVRGQKVATLINEELSPGTYKTAFDAGDLASGIYLYRLTSGDFQSVKKMILMK